MNARLRLTLLPLFLLIQERSFAELPAGLEDAMVRIYNCLPDPGGAPGAFGFEGKTSYSTGTGFVIDDQGYIATNEHVTRAKGPNGAVYWAAHKEGDAIVIYRGRLVWDSPNQDLAILQCPELKTRALPLSLFKPTKGASAYSLGYPGIGDADTTGSSGASTSFELFLKMGQLVRQNSGSQKLDITRIVGGNKTWGNLFEATFTTGTIEKESVHPGFAVENSARKEVEVWDHTLAIRHGNSGGPFLNECGQVIGVVGRGRIKPQGGSTVDVDRISWAAQISELVPVLDSKNIPYTKIASPCLAMRPVGESSTRMFLVIIASVMAAVGASLFVVLKTKGGRQTAASYTRVIEAKFKELMGGRKSSLDRGDRSIASPRHPTSPATAPGPSNGQTWALTGKTPEGRGIRLVLDEATFARNANRLVLGRSKELCHLHVDDSSVSRQHAQIRMSGSTFYVADRNSANGTSKNGRRIAEPLHEEPFRENDTLTFGEVKLVFQKL